MRELQKRQRIKQRLYSTPALVVFVVFTLFLARGAVGIMLKERQSAADVLALEAKSIALSEEERRLNTEINKLKTEEGINEEIKQKFNVSAAGERVAVIVDSSKSSSSDASSTEPWYKRFWDGILSAL
ncbi:septum formation initiator family protein [Candidatus Parcubacteria bacterium]|nr:septum formation initiator family protein [Candidatus Parcubacteria bacterium]